MHSSSFRQWSVGNWKNICAPFRLESRSNKVVVLLELKITANGNVKNRRDCWRIHWTQQEKQGAPRLAKNKQKSISQSIRRVNKITAPGRKNCHELKYSPGGVMWRQKKKKTCQKFFTSCVEIWICCEKNCFLEKKVLFRLVKVGSARRLAEGGHDIFWEKYYHPKIWKVLRL